MKAPRTWRQVTLKQFIELEDLPKTENKITRIIGQVSVMTGIDQEEIRTWRPAKLSKVAERLKFLEQLPKERKTVYFYHRFRMYKRSNLDHTTVGQVTDILTLNQNTENTGEQILNALAVLYFRGKNTEYDADRFNQMKRELETVNFQTAMSAATFFFRGLKQYLPNVLARFLKKQTAETLEKLIHEIGTLSDWSAYVKFTSGTTLR